MSSTERPTEFFYQLTQDRVLDAVEAAGFPVTGRCSALNSFENRVYDVELEMDREPGVHPSAYHRIAKFYRPGRWSEEQILEEHQFLADLKEAEIPVIAPLEFPGGGTLRRMPESGIAYALFPKVGGRAPDELDDEQLRRIGRLIARIHNVGASRKAPHRVTLTPETYGRQNLKYLVDSGVIPMEYRTRYTLVVNQICDLLEPWFKELPPHRLHGDCHLGNLLWNTQGAFFLDFDDMVNGPAMQDLWLLLPARERGGGRELSVMLEGYEEMRSFDPRQFKLVEGLRALRFVHYTAWLARRWEDPAFPPAFPQFHTDRYWSDETRDLERQLSELQTATASFY